MDDIQLGCIVKSVAGRDKGRLFVVVGLEENYARLSDGRMRRIEKPKRKKLKHLKMTSLYEGRVSSKLKAFERVHNSELRRMLSEFMAQIEELSQRLEV
jgi:large subunit ribosomal protein L14e